MDLEHIIKLSKPSFNLTATGRYEQGGFAVYPNSILFEAGDYPDKGFSMSPAELSEAVEHFTPFGGNIEHTDFLSGRACQVRAMWTDENGSTLRGEVAVPLGLDKTLGEDDKHLSVEINMEPKFFTGIALCVSPRVRTAHLMSTAEAMSKVTHQHTQVCFNTLVSAFGDPTITTFGKQAGEPMQQLHDMSCRFGAECPGKSLMSDKLGMTSEGTAAFITPALLKAVQHHHDHSMSNGASCDNYATRRDYSYYALRKVFSAKGPAAPAKEETIMSDTPQNQKTYLETIGASVAALFATNKPADTPAANTQAPVMPTIVQTVGLSEDDRKMFNTLIEQNKKANEQIEAQAKQIAELSGNVSLATTSIDAQKAETRYTANIAFLATAVAAFKITPAMRDKYAEVAKKSPDAFETIKPVIESMEPIAALTGVAAGTRSASEYELDASAQFNKLVKERTSKEIPYDVAMSQIAAENKQLAIEVRDQEMKMAGSASKGN